MDRDVGIEQKKIRELIKNSPMNSTFKDAFEVLQAIEKPSSSPGENSENIAIVLQSKGMLLLKYFRYLKTVNYLPLNLGDKIKELTENPSTDVLSDLILRSTPSPLIDVIFSGENSFLHEQYFDTLVAYSEIAKKYTAYIGSENYNKAKIYTLMSGLGGLLQAEQLASEGNKNYSDMGCKLEYTIFDVNTILKENFFLQNGNLAIPQYMRENPKTYVFDNVTYKTLFRSINLLFGLNEKAYFGTKAITFVPKNLKLAKQSRENKNGKYILGFEDARKIIIKNHPSLENLFEDDIK